MGDFYAAMDSGPFHWLADDQGQPPYFFRDFGFDGWGGLDRGQLVVQCRFGQ